MVPVDAVRVLPLSIEQTAPHDFTERDGTGQVPQNLSQLTQATFPKQLSKQIPAMASKLI